VPHLGISSVKTAEPIQPHTLSIKPQAQYLSIYSLSGKSVARLSVNKTHAVLIAADSRNKARRFFVAGAR
jgi:hypothetical protein